MEAGDILVLFFFTLSMMGSAFFSGLETAVTSASLLKISAEHQTGNERAGRLTKFLENKEELVTITVLGNNICLILVTVLLSDFATEPWQKWLLTIGETLLLVIFGEIIPKAIFRKQPEKLLLLTLTPVRIIRWVLFPLSFLFTRLSLGMLRLAGHHRVESGLYISRQEIARLVNTSDEESFVGRYASDSGSRRDYLDPADNSVTQLERVQAILRLKDVQVAHIMTPRADVKMVEEEQSLPRLVEYATEFHYTRVPLYREMPDNVTGYLDLNKLLRARRGQTPAALAEPAVFVPETQNLNSLIEKMKKHKVKLVFVINEHGTFTGIATWEDIVEEIVGDVYSRERSEREPIRVNRAGDYEIDCRITLEDLNDRFKWNLSSETERTLAGYLLEIFEGFPARNARLRDAVSVRIKEENPKISPAELAERLRAYPDFRVKDRTNRALQTVVLSRESVEEVRAQAGD